MAALTQHDLEQNKLAASEGFGISRNEDGMLVRDTPAPTVKFMKRFIKPGLTLLKFGAAGQPHERVFRLAGDMSTISYQGGWISKLGRMIIIETKKITAIQKGQATKEFQRMKSYFGGPAAEATSLYIEYRDRRGKPRTLNVMAPNPEIYEYLLNCLKEIQKKNATRAAELSMDSQYIEALWSRADKDKSGTLDKKEIVNLVAAMNANLPRRSIEAKFDQVDEDKSGDLAFDEFVRFLDLLRDRKDLLYIFSRIEGRQEVGDRARVLDFKDNEEQESELRTKTISIEQFQKFWLNTQGQDLTAAMVVKVFDIANPNGRKMRALVKLNNPMAASSKQEFRISYQMFTNVMSMADNDLFDLSKQSLYQDMTRPLSYYYIASSHNTYLEGDQLASASSVKRYIDDLKNGCRCVELDVWDGNNGKPIITHGHTLTGTILFEDVIKAINDYGFENNPFPIILSIEQHCSLQQQRTQATILKTVLKNRLVPALKEVALTQTLPSPQELRGKVLIKGKRSGVDFDLSSVSGDAFDAEDRAAASSGASSKMVDKSKHSETDEQLSALTFLAAGKVKNFDGSEKSISCYVMASYSESATNKLLGKSLEPWIKHNANHMSRVFPSGARVDSSNYNPTDGWAAGCQLVALNYQTHDEAMHVNKGKFRENGGVGYVLKPESMINPMGLVSPKIRLSINVISGQQLPKPQGQEKGEIIDPYVIVSICGEPGDTNSHKTHVVSNNGFNPVWNKLFTFDIASPDTALITFHVRDEDNTKSEFIGFQSLPISCLRPGLRVVQLCDADGTRHGDFSFASLFVWVGVDLL